MIRFADICDRIIKINNSVKREKCMNKNTLINNENVVIDSKKDKEIENVIMAVCSADNLCSYSQFEQEELKFLEKKFSNMGQDENVVIDDFLSKEMIDDFKLASSIIIRSLKANDFKKSYFQNLKKQKMLNRDLSGSVKCGKQLIKLTSEEQRLESDYEKCLKDFKDIQNENLKKYTQMIKEFCEKKELPDSISEIRKRYSAGILQTFLARKIVYLIFRNFNKNNVSDIVKIIEDSERIKIAFGTVYQRILAVLRCGNK